MRSPLGCMRYQSRSLNVDWGLARSAWLASRPRVEPYRCARGEGTMSARGARGAAAGRAAHLQIEALVVGQVGGEEIVHDQDANVAAQGRLVLVHAVELGQQGVLVLHHVHVVAREQLAEKVRLAALHRLQDVLVVGRQPEERSARSGIAQSAQRLGAQRELRAGPRRRSISRRSRLGRAALARRRGRRCSP